MQDAINTLNEDPDGNLWIGTDTSGAVRIAAFGLVSYFVADGLRHDYVPFLIEGDAGRVNAVSAYRFTINEFDGRRFVSARFNVPPDVPDDRYSSVLRDHQGAWWLGTAMGLYRFPPVRRIADLARVPPEAHYARLPALPSDNLFPLFEDVRGDIWLIAQLPDRRQTSSVAPCDERLPDIRRIRGARRNHVAAGNVAPRDRRVPSRSAVLWIPRGRPVRVPRRPFRGHPRWRRAVRRRQPSYRSPGPALDHRRGRLRAPHRRSVDSQSGERHDSCTQPRGRATSGAWSRTPAGSLYFGTTSGIIEVDPRTGDTRRYTTAEGLAKNEVWSALASRRGDESGSGPSPGCRASMRRARVPGRPPRGL